MQFQLVLAWACSTLSLQQQKSFNQGQRYVALSRIRSLKSLYLIEKYTPGAIKANRAAK